MTHRFEDITFTDSVKAAQQHYGSHPHNEHLKILGQMRVEHASDVKPEVLATVDLPDYKARIERVVFIDVAAFDWNCPQHITRRYTELEFSERLKNTKP